MARKARLGLYLEDEGIKKKIKIAAAKRGVSATAYCAEAIKEYLTKDGELNNREERERLALLSRMDKLKKEIGPLRMTAAELIKEGRRR